MAMRIEHTVEVPFIEGASITFNMMASETVLDEFLKSMCAEHTDEVIVSVAGIDGLEAFSTDGSYALRVWTANTGFWQAWSAIIDDPKAKTESPDSIKDINEGE